MGIIVLSLEKLGKKKASLWDRAAAWEWRPNLHFKRFEFMWKGNLYFKKIQLRKERGKYEGIQI